MAWLRTNWRLALLNVFGVTVLLTLILQTGEMSVEELGSIVFTPLFEGGGLWAIRFLLFCLAMTPLNTLFGWRYAVKLRKSAGLWAFGFGSIHFLLYLSSTVMTLEIFFNEPYYILGGLGLSILTALAITSNRWAMKGLGKTWKRLHRLVYVAGIAVTLHAILAYAGSKKMFLSPEMKTELNIYLAVMVLLLALRLPFVKSLLKPLGRTRTRSRALPAQ
jgi:sulfoxide reductase heme-binding subunit YedZ